MFLEHNILGEKIVDVSSGEEIFRPYNDDEISEVELAKQLAEDEKEASLIKNENRKNILAKLGLTEEEAKILLG